MQICTEICTASNYYRFISQKMHTDDEIADIF